MERKWTKRSDNPPPGKYMLYIPKIGAIENVTVGRGIFQWNGRFYPLAVAFAEGSWLEGPLEREVKSNA